MPMNWPEAFLVAIIVVCVTILQLRRMRGGRDMREKSEVFDGMTAAQWDKEQEAWEEWQEKEADDKLMRRREIP